MRSPEIGTFNFRPELGDELAAAMISDDHKEYLLGKAATLNTPHTRAQMIEDIRVAGVISGTPEDEVEAQIHFVSQVPVRRDM